MKYNKSEIMKKAWFYVKKTGCCMSAALTCAWSEARQAIKVASQKIIGKHIQILEIKKWFLKKMDAVTFMALECGIWIDDIVLEKETKKAIQISTEWNGYKKKIWMPKSVVVFR